MPLRTFMYATVRSTPYGSEDTMRMYVTYFVPYAN